nr:hypothetical protein P9270_018625 [Mesorhizobium sp. WSM4875]
MRLRFVLRAGTANRYTLTATLPMRQAESRADIPGQPSSTLGDVDCTTAFNTKTSLAISSSSAT